MSTHAPTPGEFILEVNNVSLSFKGVKAISDLSFRVRRGEICALIGPNGAGKSTTLKAISGLIHADRARLTRGRIRFHGEDTAGVPPNRLARRGIAHVLEGRHVFAHLSVEDNLRSGGFLRGPGRREPRRRPPASRAAPAGIVGGRSGPVCCVGSSFRADLFSAQHAALNIFFSSLFLKEFLVGTVTAKEDSGCRPRHIRNDRGESMSKKVKVVAVSGGLQRPSRTLTLVEALIDALGERASIETHLIELGEVGPKLAGVLYPNQLPAEVRKDIAAIESADFLIVASPVYRASFTGLFKHLFDFVDHNALNDVPVLLAATGGSDRHALVIDHQLRPLFSFFQAQTLPIGVYGAEADFENYRVSSPALKARISLAADRAAPFLTPRATAAQPQLAAA